jgi:hypothetical protein
MGRAIAESTDRQVPRKRRMTLVEGCICQNYDKGKGKERNKGMVCNGGKGGYNGGYL